MLKKNIQMSKYAMLMIGISIVSGQMCMQMGSIQSLAQMDAQ